MKNLRFGVYGAGSIGCYLGAHLVRQAVPTVLLGRARLQQEIRTHGLRVTGLNQIDFHLEPADIDYVTEPECLADCNVILVTVKSLDTGSAGEALRRLQPNGKPRLIISFQNGLSNADILRRAL
ncbi:MAG: 2-dehydropantoate 2-reductase, partial [Leptospiraceae bacterium]|nr:2-dehydropantoate 2-reductase [Leptospiraceae bacterium]